MKILLVGDLHVQQNNIEDTGELFGLVDQILDEDKGISHVCFLGDIFHTHDVVRQEPAFFVRSKISEIAKKFGSRVAWIALAGNHDYSTPSASTIDNAVRLVLGDLLTVVDSYSISLNPEFNSLPFFFIPFIGDNERFIKIVEGISPDKILICHQTFDGSKYENNQTAPNGVDQNRVPQKLIISGHIHTKQNLKNNHNEVVYVGTPRALTSNEVNQKKYLTVYDSDLNIFTLHPTDHLVKQFISFEINQGDEQIAIVPTWKAKDDVRIHVNGNQEFYVQVLEANAHLTGQARFIPNIRKELSKTLDLDSGEFTIDEALHKYVHEVIDVSDDLRKEIWTKLQALIPQLGTKP
jgi:DNA repair exonuclease SbcCD nuclease subunit